MDYFIGFLAGLPLWAMFYLLARRQWHRSQRDIISQLKQQHRQEFQTMISKINHEGPIKEGVTADGLVNLILWVMQNSIKNLETLYVRQDWNTMPVITELRQIVMVELRLLHNQVANYVESIRNHLRDYNKYQE